MHQPGPGPRLVVGAAILSWVSSTGCIGLGSGPSPVVDDEVAAVGPTKPGTYRMVGTERDSRTGETRRVVETYIVDSEFTRGEDDHQITRYHDSEGSSRTWETAFRRTGAYRLHETAGDASWDWSPPLLSIASPLRMGRVWAAEATASLPDLAGTRRLTSVANRSRVVDTTSISVGGERVSVLVIDAAVSTTVTDTNRVDRSPTTFVSRTRVRNWFSPEHMLVVKSSGTTTVKGRVDVADDDGGPGAVDGGEYVLVRRVQVDKL